MVIVKNFAAKFNAMTEDELSFRPAPGKWSRKEVLGHLIDSAQNNLRRFIVGQYEEAPSRIVYEQDFWVRCNDYQNMPKNDIIRLWELMNGRIAVVLGNMPEDKYEKHALTSEWHTLRWLAEDYVKHMKHHLNQIIAGSF